MDNTSYINAEIYIKEKDINKKIRIINSYENVQRELKSYEIDEQKNEKKIKKCKIKIDGESIPFCYFYRFNESGKYHIQYSFSIKLTNINYMFYRCCSLTNIDLSNFNTQNVECMSDMFHGCSSLTNIDLSNFNTQKVTDMSDMFYGCSSLIKMIKKYIN